MLTWRKEHPVKKWVLHKRKQEQKEDMAIPNPPAAVPMYYKDGTVRPTCTCGKPVYCKGLCTACYFKAYRSAKLHTKTTLTSGQKAWATRLRRLGLKESGKQNQASTSSFNYTDKNNIRQRVVTLFEEYVVSGSNILVLETKEKLLLKELRASQFWKAINKIYIPNSTEHLKLNKQEKKRVDFLAETYLSCVVKPGIQFHAVWADYCGSYCTYSKDIKKAFANQCFADRSVLIATFSSHGGVQIDTLEQDYSSVNYWINAAAQLEYWAEHYGYKARLLPAPSGVYKGKGGAPMYNLAYEITKI
jgi:hypothetical protein